MRNQNVLNDIVSKAETCSRGTKSWVFGFCGFFLASKFILERLNKLWESEKRKKKIVTGISACLCLSVTARTNTDMAGNPKELAAWVSISTVDVEISNINPRRWKLAREDSVQYIQGFLPAFSHNCPINSQPYSDGRPCWRTHSQWFPCRPMRFSKTKNKHGSM